MAFLSKTEKLRIAEAVSTAEKKTSGEIVTVMARASDDYLQIALLWAGFIALSAPGLILLLKPDTSVFYLYEIQLSLFVAAMGVLHWSPLKMFFVPAALQRRYARRLAREQFFVQGLHLTHERTGVLLFVSVAERYVEILADAGIHERSSKGEWDDIVTHFIADVTAGRIEQGFLSAIAACGDKLAQHFPRHKNDQNELPNRLIEL
ncbi:MAG TPA: TPM domain-containing protein [Acidiferrobacterales bacterium]|nr:TPM domain-containing protein [Acidiferrobacterales bacterium]